MHIGFTGTRQGMTDAQKKSVRNLLVEITRGDTIVHHGDCVGADDEFHTIAYHFGAVIRIHPGNIEKYRAYAHERLPANSTVVYEPKDPLIRNRDIVVACEVLIATPAGLDYPRSGTWDTIRVGRKHQKPVWMVWPDGKTWIT